MFETLHLCSLTQTLSLVGTLLLPVDRIPNEGVRQRNVCEDRCQTPQILVIWSVENVVDPTCGVKISREAARRVNPRCETSLLPGLLPHCLHRIMPHQTRDPRVFRAALHLEATLINLLPTRAQNLLLRLRRKKGGRGDTEEVRPRQTPLRKIRSYTAPTVLGPASSSEL